MSATLYDKALVKKFNLWTENTEIHLYGPNESKKLVETIADETKDNPIKLPIISLSRVDGYDIVNSNKKPLTYDGLMLEADETKSVSLNAIPIKLTYQLDVWTRYYEEADAYMRNLLFNIINYPKVEVVIPYNDINLIHDSSLRIATNVIDSSDELRIVSGQFTRLTLALTIDDAYIWDVRIRDNISVGLQDVTWNEN